MSYALHLKSSDDLTEIQEVWIGKVLSDTKNFFLKAPFSRLKHCKSRRQN